VGEEQPSVNEVDRLFVSVDESELGMIREELPYWSKASQTFEGNCRLF
jgi:hypothetical protein